MATAPSGYTLLRRGLGRIRQRQCGGPRRQQPTTATTLPSALAEYSPDYGAPGADQRSSGYENHPHHRHRPTLSPWRGSSWPVRAGPRERAAPPAGPSRPGRRRDSRQCIGLLHRRGYAERQRGWWDGVGAMGDKGYGPRGYALQEAGPVARCCHCVHGSQSRSIRPPARAAALLHPSARAPMVPPW